MIGGLAILGVAVGDLAGGRVKVGHRHAAVITCDGHMSRVIARPGPGDILTAQANVGDAGLRRYGHGASDRGLATFHHAMLAGISLTRISSIAWAVTIGDSHRRRGIIVPLDGDRQGRGIAVTIAVGDGVAERLGQRVTVLERLHRGAVGVNTVAPGTITIIDQSAVAPLSR